MKTNLRCYLLLLMSLSFTIIRAQVPPGNALNFDGTNDYVDIGTSATLYASNIKTMECWVKFNTLAADQEIISRSLAGNGIELLVYGGNLAVYCMDGNGNTSFIGYPTSNLQTGIWYHVAFSWDGTKENMRLYVNGSSVGTRSDFGNINTGIPNNAAIRVYLGRWNDAGAPRYFSGSLDEVRIWSTNRSQAVIQASMLNVLSLPATGLLAYYKFDQGTAGGNNTSVTTATDASVNGFTGTLTNFTLTNQTTSNWVESYAMVVPAVAAATSVTSSGFNAVWTAPAVGTVEKYLLDVSTSSTFSSFVSGYSAKDVGNVTSFAVTGLTPQTTYYYRVRPQKTSVLNQAGYSGTASTATLAQTPPGNAINISGTATGVLVPANTAFDFATGTVELWVKRDAIVAANTYLLGTRDDPNGTRYSVHMNNNDNTIGVWNGGSYSFISSPFPLVAGKWYHIAVVIKATTSDIYVNGVYTGSTTNGMGSVTGLPLRVGTSGSAANGEQLNGSVDEVRVWNTQRTPAQIKANMYDTVPAASTGLVAYYKFDQGVAGGANAGLTTALDATSNARNGTLFGFGLSGSSSNWVESYAMVIPATTAATSVNSKSATVNWTSPPRGMVEKYLLDVSANRSFSSFVTGFSSKDVGLVTSASITGLSPNTKYYYRIRAEKAPVTGEGAYALDSLTTAPVYTWTGGSGDWTIATNWSTNSVPSGCFADVVIASGSPTISTAVSAGTLSISSGISMTITGSLSVCGSFTGGSGTAATTTGAGKVIFNGSTAQAISGNTTFNNLELNNAAGASVAVGGTLSITGVYTPSAGTLTTNGGFVLKSSAAGTAMVYRGTGTYISGNVTVERYIPAKRAWRYLTAPLSNTGTIFSNWQNNGSVIASTGVEIWRPSGGGGFVTGGSGTSIQQYNEVSDSWSALANTNATNLSNNDGGGGNTVADNNAFGLFITGPYGSGNISPYSTVSSTTLKATGQLQTGTQTFTYNNLAANRFILIGNPYAAPVDFASVGKSNIKNTFWAWDPQRSGTSLGGYVTVSYDAVNAVYDIDYNPLQTAQTQVIQNGQAVFVQVQSGSTTTAVTFNETDKTMTGNTNGVFRGMGTDLSQQLRVALNRVNGAATEAIDGVLAKFATAYKNTDEDDALKLYNYDENMSLKRNGLKLSIERKPMSLQNDTLFLSLEALKANSTYSFDFDGRNFEGQLVNAFLADNYLGTQTPISLTNSAVVNFGTDNTPASLDASRFMVVFKPATALPISFTGVKAWQNGSVVQVEWNVKSETGIQRYVVERSADLNVFTEVGSIAARNNNIAETYNQPDPMPFAGDNFYRVKVVEKSGAVRYSSVVKVRITTGAPSFTVYPNPVKNRNVAVNLANLPKGTYDLAMYDQQGRMLLSDKIDHVGNSSGHVVVLPNGISTGTYYFQLRQVKNPAVTFRQDIIVQ